MYRYGKVQYDYSMYSYRYTSVHQALICGETGLHTDGSEKSEKRDF